MPVNHFWLWDNLRLSITQKCQEGKKLEIILLFPPPLPLHRSPPIENYEARGGQQQDLMLCLLIKSAQR